MFYLWTYSIINVHRLFYNLFPFVTIYNLSVKSLLFNDSVLNLIQYFALYSFK